MSPQEGTQVRKKAASMKHARLPGGRRVWCTPRGADELRVVFQEIFEEKTYERGGMQVDDGDVVVDVGANVGLFALSLLERHRGLRLICVEPVPPIRACLERNLKTWSGQNGHEITVLPWAVGAAEGETTIQFWPGIPANSTVHPADKHAEIEQVVGRFTLRDVWNMNRSRRNGTAIAMLLFTLLIYPFRRSFYRAVLRHAMRGSEAFACKVRRLKTVLDDCALLQVDLLKMDVEGAEFDVIEGLGEDGLARVRQIAMEAAPCHKARLPALMVRLREIGFRQLSLESVAGRTHVLDDPYPCMLYASRLPPALSSTAPKPVLPARSGA